MLIFLDTAIGRAGVEEGVIRAGDVPVLDSLAALRDEIVRCREQLVEDATRESADVVRQARQQAEVLLAQAREEAQAMRERARAEGLDQAVKEWHERHAEVAVDRARALRDLVPRLSEIVARVVQRIVERTDRAALYRRALRSMQALTRGASVLRLRVGRDEQAEASAVIAGFGELAGSSLSVEVVGDPALPPGSCVFESDLGVLDASLSVQLEAFRSAIDRAVRRATGEPGE